MGVSTLSVRKWLRRATVSAMDLLLPPACNFCGCPLASPALQPLLCGPCRRSLLNIVQPLCKRCAAPISETNLGDDCPRCRDRRYHFQSVLTLGLYRDELRDAVIRMKQRSNEALALSMGVLAARVLKKPISRLAPDVMAAVPTHWLKRMIRGTNGPDLLVEGMGSVLPFPTATALLYCRRRTQKQGTLMPSERLINVRNAFALNSGYDIRDAHVLLVDDIMTTGATASEAARTLRRAGAAVVTIAVVARGTGQSKHSPAPGGPDRPLA